MKEQKLFKTEKQTVYYTDDNFILTSHEDTPYFSENEDDAKDMAKFLEAEDIFRHFNKNERHFYRAVEVKGKIGCFEELKSAYFENLKNNEDKSK